MAPEKPEKPTRAEQAQGCDHASSTGRMRIELAAAAPSMQRMMLQRALDKGKFAAWERATVAERDMCMYLPQTELLDALDNGNNGVRQLLDNARISLMVGKAVAIRGERHKKRQHGEKPNMPDKSTGKKALVELQGGKAGQASNISTHPRETAAHACSQNEAIATTVKAAGSTDAVQCAEDTLPLAAEDTLPLAAVTVSSEDQMPQGVTATAGEVASSADAIQCAEDTAPPVVGSAGSEGQAPAEAMQMQKGEGWAPTEPSLHRSGKEGAGGDTECIGQE